MKGSLVRAADSVWRCSRWPLERGQGLRLEHRKARLNFFISPCRPVMTNAGECLTRNAPPNHEILRTLFPRGVSEGRGCCTSLNEPILSISCFSVMATVVSESNPSRPLVDKGKDDDDDENATGSSTMVFNAKLEILAEQPLTKATGKDPQDQQEFDGQFFACRCSYPH